MVLCVTRKTGSNFPLTFLSVRVVVVNELLDTKPRFSLTPDGCARTKMTQYFGANPNIVYDTITPRTAKADYAIDLEKLPTKPTNKGRYSVSADVRRSFLL